MTEDERNEVLHFEFDIAGHFAKEKADAFFRLLCTYGIKYRMEVPEFFRPYYTAEDGSQRVFPEFREYFPDLDPKKEEERMKQEEKEELFFIQDLLKIFAYGEIDGQKFKKMREPQRDELAEKYAKEYQLELPERIKRRLRNWTGPDSYKELKKAPGYKSPMKVERIIHDRFPLSTKGFKKIVGPEFTSYTRKIGNKEVKMVIATELISMPAGDLPKRLFRGIAMFSSQRKTLDPGPIEYRELLDRIGELPCSESHMERIRDLCLAISYSSITVKTKDRKGELIHSDHAPFFKRFIWDGKVDFNARIFPIMNDELFKLLIDEELTQYVWIPAERLKPARKLTARDRLAQDQFRMLTGIPFQRIKMRNWLYKFGQFTEIELEKLGIEKIRAFVNRAFEQAKKEGLILDHKIKRLYKKSKYLDQVISFWPAQAKPPKEKVRLTKEELKEVREIADWLYEVGVEDYAEIEQDRVLECVMNAAEAGNLDCIRKAYENTEEEGPEPDYPVNEERRWEGRPMYFWGMYQSLRDEKKG
ncbi:hypothetical protein ES705_29073 [subsurface metagenome]